ncbi:hypothetical protein [Pandoraea anhela]|uniref:hypothetical protein n=1 Tax=Pandoraea anhela TaxID=2508295 RepID=UPI00123F95E4|nr:hypothetical protein [Pandoraea anhela]
MKCKRLLLAASIMMLASENALAKQAGDSRLEAARWRQQAKDNAFALPGDVRHLHAKCAAARQRKTPLSDKKPAPFAGHHLPAICPQTARE